MSLCRSGEKAVGANQGPGSPEGVRLPARFDAPPAEPGLLAEPDIARWPAVAARNRRLLLDGAVTVAGVALTRARDWLRRELPELPLPLDPDGPPVYVAGHQPLLYHPGVWVKLFAGARAAAASGGRLINLVVDSDVSDLSVPLPALIRDPDGYQRPGIERDEPEGTGSPELPLERRPAPDPEAWAAFVERVRARVMPLSPGAAGRLDPIAAVRPEPSENVAAFLSRVRRAWEASGVTPGPAGYVELPISTLSATLPFRLWVVEWALHAEFWRCAYNEALRQYRQLHRLRYPANPFPDLAATDHGIELPFWVLRQVEGAWVREGLLVQGGSERTAAGASPRPRTARILLTTLGAGGAQPLAELPAGEPLEAARVLGETGIQVRPKAIPLTLFARLFLGDLFIHGTGGARYESIGDFLLAARWPGAFGKETPGYAVCSATVHLDMPAARERAARREWLEELVRSLQHNPQRIVAELDGALGSEAARAGIELEREELAGLAARKAELVEQIQSGGDRKALGEAIRHVNGELNRRLAPLAAYLGRELEAARGAEAVVSERSYPFFLFDPGEIWALLESHGVAPRRAARG